MNDESRHQAQLALMNDDAYFIYCTPLELVQTIIDLFYNGLTNDDGCREIAESLPISDWANTVHPDTDIIAVIEAYLEA